MEEKSFLCEKCNYQTRIKASFEQHLKTYLHITGKRKTRSDKLILKCDYCVFETNNKNNHKSHHLNNHASIEERSKEYTFYCSVCDFGTFEYNLMVIHEETNKHNLRSIIKIS